MVLDCLFVVRLDERPSVRFDPNEAIVSQHQQRFAEWNSADTEPLGEFGLVEAVIGTYCAVPDHLPDCLSGAFGRRRPVDAVHEFRPESRRIRFGELAVEIGKGNDPAVDEAILRRVDETRVH